MLPSYDPLLGFKVSQGEFVTYQIGNSPNKRLWLAIRYSHPKGLEIKERDVIKLGRIRLKVRKIVTVIGNHEGNIQKCFESLASKVDAEVELEEDAQCRICFGTESLTENPLITPCDCTGSIKYIHTECIRHWLRSRIQTKTTFSTTSYYWTDLNCELCKTSLPSSVYYMGMKIDLISIDYPDKPYILLEEYSPDNFNSSGVHIVAIDDGKTISIGRAQEADFRITDISVSRNHASLSFVDEKFVISDKKSKFGTLIKMKKVVTLQGGHNFAIQVGRTLFHVKVEKKINLQKCCCNPFKKIAPEWSYITQEGIDQSALEPEMHNFRNVGRSFSYIEE
jgi:hypothetical protein